jgi:chromosome segregation ATPase
MDELKPKSSKKTPQTSDSFLALERRLEKIEIALNIADELNLVKKQQEESKQYETDRRLDAIDNRLKRIEKNISDIIIDLEDKFEQQESQILVTKQIPAIKSELQDLKCSFYTDERIAALEKDMNLKIQKMFEAIEDLSRTVAYKEKEIDRLKKEIQDLRSENEKYIGEREQQSLKIKELINQMEEIWRRQEIIDQYYIGHRPSEESQDEEEVFLNKLKTGGYAFQ